MFFTNRKRDWNDSSCRKRTNIILFYSDGERASFIKMKEWSANEKIHSISNIDDDGEYDHKSIGHIFFKFDGTILEKRHSNEYL